MSTELRPDIYKYHDYRVFLKETMVYLQQQDSEFSLRKLAQKADLATGYLPMVLSGKRNLSHNAVDALKKPLHLKPDEVSYLKYMTELNDSDSRDHKLEILKKMQKFQKYEEGNSKELEAYKYLTKWQYVALREMMNLETFKDNIDWIQERLTFAATPKEITEGLDFLLKNHFVTKTKNKYLPKEKIIDCFDGIYRLSLGEFYKQIFQLAIESIDKVPRSERLILGHTMAASPEAFTQISQVLQEAFEKVRDIERNDKNKKQLYQVTFASFPLTKKDAP